MLRVGLTGGLCSGKSTVAAWLAEMGIPVLNADAIGHEFLAAGTPVYAALVNTFGPAILDAGGAVDRRALASRAFASPAATRSLNAILHPPIQAEADRRLAELERAGQPLAVVEAALFIEAGSHRRFDRLVVVTCDREEKIRRFLLRAHASRAEAEARLAAQMPDEEKARLADFVVDNSGTLDGLRRQVNDLGAQLRVIAGAE
ncbi:MAG: dephospho-CoA kinase [Terriglobales bacterium]